MMKKTGLVKPPAHPVFGGKVLTLWRGTLTACFPAFLWYQSGLNTIFISTPTETDKKTFRGCSRLCPNQPPLRYCTYFFVRAGGFSDAELKVIQQKWKCVSWGFRIAVIREFFLRLDGMSSHMWPLEKCRFVLMCPSYDDRLDRQCGLLNISYTLVLLNTNLLL